MLSLEWRLQSDWISAWLACEIMLLQQFSSYTNHYTSFHKRSFLQSYRRSSLGIENITMSCSFWTSIKLLVETIKRDLAGQGWAWSLVPRTHHPIFVRAIYIYIYRHKHTTVFETIGSIIFVLNHLVKTPNSFFFFFFEGVNQI